MEVSYKLYHKRCSRLEEVVACGHGDTAPWLQRRVFVRWVAVALIFIELGLSLAVSGGDVASDEVLGLE